MRAQLALGDEPQFRWLLDRRSFDQGSKSWRPEILGELGRLAREQGKERMRSVAALLCEQQPGTEQALALISRARAGEIEAAPAARLTEAVLAAVADFRARYPDVPRAAVITAVEDAVLQLRAGDGSSD